MLASNSILKSWNWRIFSHASASSRGWDSRAASLTRGPSQSAGICGGGKRAARRLIVRRSRDLFRRSMRPCGVYCAADRRIRYVLEARVLAGEALESIATGLGTTVDVVAAYVAAFFDVGPQLECADLIVARLFASSSDRPYDFFDRGLKFVGYVGGSQSLSAVLGTLRSESADRLKTLQQEASRLIIVWRAYEDLITGGKLTTRELREYLPLLKDRDIVGERVDEYAANVEQMLMSVPLAFLDREDALRLQKREGLLEPRATSERPPDNMTRRSRSASNTPTLRKEGRRGMSPRMGTLH